MKLRSLQAVIRLRRMVVDDARRHLVNCTQAETNGTAAVRDQTGEITRQRQAAEALGTDDADVEAFGAWFQPARARLHGLIAARDRTAIDTARARAELAVARTALEVVETMEADIQRAARAEALRREQILSDEAAGRPAPNPPSE